MRSFYARHQRDSIYHPATIGDIPQEVLRKAFIYLLPGKADLVAPSEACRAWRPVAQEVMHSSHSFGEDRQFERFLCGFHLQSLVFGVGSISINRLELDMLFISRENATLLAQKVAPSLSSLNLQLYADEDGLALPSTDCYSILEVFFLRCRWIRSLILDVFDFGVDPLAISSSVKEGFGRLTKLDLSDCHGNIRMFVENTPIRDLRKLRFESYLGEDGDADVIVAIAKNYPTVTSIDIIAALTSSYPLLNIFNGFRVLENLAFYCRGALELESSDIKAIASLPLLKFLDIRHCKMTDKAVSALSNCVQLKHLKISSCAGMNDVLRVIGMNLKGLGVRNAPAEVWLGAAENCPSLEYLVLNGGGLKDAVMVGSLNDGLKRRMKRLSSLKVNQKVMRLGTDWVGY
jgi:hypothetical protein